MGLKTVTQMITELQTRVPIGLAQTFCENRLNDAYNWTCQRAAMNWLLSSAAVVVTSAGTFPLPGTAYIGKPMYLSGTSTVGGLMEIPYKPYDVALKNQHYGMTITRGMYSVWTFNGTTGYVFPVEAWPTVTHTLTLVFHATPGVAVVGATPFPSPAAFDSMFVDLAESETKRIYNIAGWDIIQKRGQDSVLALVDQYRSTKNAIAGMADQAKQTQETQLQKGE
ncbi:MAG: hypothetical protein WCO20_11375 [Holophagaceae bacterium]